MKKLAGISNGAVTFIADETTGRDTLLQLIVEHEAQEEWGREGVFAVVSEEDGEMEALALAAMYDEGIIEPDNVPFCGVTIVALT